MRSIIKPINLMFSEINAFFTTKSQGINLKEISTMVNIPENHVYLPLQKHTDKVAILEYDMSPTIADAVVTQRKGILIGVQVADCVPVLLYDRKRSVIGAVHAGWRGTSQQIIKKAINKICERFSSLPQDIFLAIGPSIKGCCYEVDYEVLCEIEKSTGKGEYWLKKGNKYHIDLSLANKYQALHCKIPDANIWLSDDCTFCSPERFYSYRYSKGTTGRQGAFIGMI